jgi:hypothetical protein
MCGLRPVLWPVKGSVVYKYLLILQGGKSG